MARKSLRPHSNQIRAWVRQGRTDAWIAHQLEVTVQEIEQFKRQNEFVSDEEATEGSSAAAYPEEIDLRAEDDALIAAELEAAAAAAAEQAASEAEAAERNGDGSTTDDGEDSEDGEDESGTRTRRRGRRGGRGRRSGARPPATIEGTFDHGEEGYGLWLDPSVQDNATYAEHWAGHRPIVVTIEEEQIVIRRVGEND